MSTLRRPLRPSARFSVVLDGRLRSLEAAPRCRWSLLFIEPDGCTVVWQAGDAEAGAAVVEDDVLTRDASEPHRAFLLRVQAAARIAGAAVVPVYLGRLPAAEVLQ